MQKKTGVWIDTKKAVLVFIEENRHVVSTIYSLIESRERIPGEVKWYTRFGSSFFSFEKKKERRKDHDVQKYLRKVINEIRGSDEIVVFGPGQMKTELEKNIRKDPAMISTMISVETADSMTDNQVIAWVKNYFNR